jgi:hypothetical protein
MATWQHDTPSKMVAGWQQTFASIGTLVCGAPDDRALSRRFAHRNLVFARILRGSGLLPREYALQKLRHSTAIEVDDHLMVLHALPALYKTQVPHETIMTVAHASEATIPEHPAQDALADDSVKS